MRNLLTNISMLFIFWSGRMDSGKTQKSVGQCRTVDLRMSTSVLACDSDSILRGFCAPYISNRRGLRQTDQATLRGTQIPCPRRPHNPNIYSFGINWLPRNKSLRQWNLFPGSPVCVGGAMARISIFADAPKTAFFLKIPSYKLPSLSLIPEVQRCR